MKRVVILGLKLKNAGPVLPSLTILLTERWLTYRMYKTLKSKLLFFSPPCARAFANWKLNVPIENKATPDDSIAFLKSYFLKIRLKRKLRVSRMRAKINNISRCTFQIFLIWWTIFFQTIVTLTAPQRRSLYICTYIHVYMYRRTERNAKIVNDIKFFALNCIPFARNSHISISALLNFPRVHPSLFPPLVPSFSSPFPYLPIDFDGISIRCSSLISKLDSPLKMFRLISHDEFRDRKSIPVSPWTLLPAGLYSRKIIVATCSSRRFAFRETGSAKTRHASCDACYIWRLRQRKVNEETPFFLLLLLLFPFRPRQSPSFPPPS